MGIEAATFISDLDPTLPTSTDLRSQGDDHIRLEKAVLKNSFPTASKAWYNPNTAAKTVDFVAVAADMNKTFLVNTGGAAVINMTLPSLVAGDAGWECFVIKTTTDVNPIIIGGAAGSITSGQISGLASARRCIPGVRIQCLWNGTGWNISRACGVPIGSAIVFHGSALPVGYEWPNGQTLTLAASRYPEYNSVLGTGTIDKRGRVNVVLDNLGGAAAGRLAGGIITGTAVGNTGGTDTVTLTLSQIPTGITSANAGAIALSVVSASNVVQGAGTIPVQQISSGGNPWTGGTNTPLTSAGNIAIGAAAVTSNNTGGGLHSNLQPSIMVSEILVVE